MMQRLFQGSPVVTVLALLFLAGCGGTTVETPRAADGTSGIPSETIATVGSTEALDEFETLTEGDLEVVAVQSELTRAEERGLMIFRHYCAHCHGDTGQGDGPNSYGLKIPPRDLLTLQLDGEHSDEELRLLITNGGPAREFSSLMPPWGRTLQPERIDDLVGLIHVLPQLGPAEQDVDTLSLDNDAGMGDFSL